MTWTDGAKAWRYLKRNPDYLDELPAAEGLPAPESGPFPLRMQTEADLNAARWGLLAWEDPLAGTEPVVPFWTEAPTLEAVAVPGPPALADLLEAPGARLSGLRLLDGAVVVKLERGEAAVHMRIADGDAFDPEGGVRVQTPAVPDLPAGLRGAADAWPIAAAAAGKKDGDIPASRTRSFSRFSTGGCAVTACAA